MNLKTLLTAIAAFAAITASANAQVRTWDGGGGNTNWNTAANWSNDNVPNSVDEQAVIPDNGGAGFYTVDLSTDITVGSLVMAPEAVLNIATTASAVLTIDKGAGSQDGLIHLQASSTMFALLNVGDDDADHAGTLRLVNNDTNDHEVGGEIVLKEADSVLDIETDDATFAPYTTYVGSVVGEVSGAIVEIDPGLTFTSEIVFEGTMSIQPESGTPTFINGYLVDANASPSLTFANDMLFDDVPGAIWRATTYDLVFVEGATGGGTRLDGEFEAASCGDLEFYATVETTGRLTQVGSVLVDFNPNVCFIYQWTSGSSNSICNDSTNGGC